ncbi:MAG TPA: acetoin utilization protein AcuC [Ktedonosporobacter sp.]|nr:acetoin utilization protein AcuC [Ktedonosporobacter sp.]
MSNRISQQHARLMFDQSECRYYFGPDHPLNPRRIQALMDLLACGGLWDSADERTRLDGRAATLDELGLVHTPEYIAAVQRLSEPETQTANERRSSSAQAVSKEEPEPEGLSEEERREREELALRYGFGEGDTPASPGLHEASARIAGGTLVAMSAVMGLPEGGVFASEDERPLHIFHPAGGLHHAWSDRASGFCVYNDVAIAIAHVLQASEAKVLYIDFDAHHGDGVQRAFYDDPRVMTVSFHETGRYLFPGTGDVLEMGRGSGYGYSVNIPLEPFTEDDSYSEAMDALLSQLVTAFAPDILITQHGCDTHAWDPLTHLSLTMTGILAQMKAAHQLAHTYCNGRWVALGGGGYDLYRVVPRAWSLLWAEMSDQQAPAEMPEEWVQRWQPEWLATQAQDVAVQQVMGNVVPPISFPTTFMDRAQDFPPRPRRWPISRTNRHTVGLVRHLLVPGSVRQAFPSPRTRSPLAGLFDLLHMNKASTPSRSKTLDTSAGSLLLRDFCPPSLVERLRPDSGLKAFARLPEREHHLLLNIAKSPDCALTLAHTTTGEIVGEVTIAPADEWWEGIDNLYEVAIQVSTNWRRMGIARNMLAFSLELDALEDMILFAIGLSWHWDTEGARISVYRYREMMVRLFASQGFAEYPTTEPNVSMEPANVLLARIGKRVDQRAASQFLSRLLNSSNLAHF